MEKTKSIRYLNTPIGVLKVEADIESIISISLEENDEILCNDQIAVENNILNDACIQIEEYFSGSRKIFNFPVNLKGTDFQMRVWKELMKIEYGKTITYGELAEEIADRKYARAVGNACKNNRVLLVVPCHRVTGVDGSLKGFSAGGAINKKILLELEKINSTEGETNELE